MIRRLLQPFALPFLLFPFSFLLLSSAAGQEQNARPELVLRIGHVDAVNAIAFSSDGQTLASAGRDRTVKLWDPHTGDLLHSLTGHTDTVLAVTFTSDGKTVLSAGREGSARLWDMRTGALLGTLSGPQMPVEAAAVWAGGANGIAKARIACAGSDKTIRVWQPKGALSGPGEVIATLTGHETDVKALAFSPDGKRLASGSADGIVKLWDVEDGSLERTLRNHAMPIDGLAFSSDGKTLADACEDGIATLWDVETGKRLGPLQMNRPGDGIGAVAFSADGRVVATGGHQAFEPGIFIKLWDAQAQKETHNLKGHERYVTAVGFSPDGRTLASGGSDDTVRLWNAQTGQEVRVCGGSESVPAVAFAPNGETLASGSADSAVRVWSAQTGELLHTLSGHTGPVRSVAFSPNGKTIASGSRDKTLRLWDAQTGAALQTFKEEGGPINTVAFSSDGTLLASGCGESAFDGSVTVREAATGKVLHTLTGESLSAVRSVAFSPDGKLIATGSGVWSVGEVRLWDAQTGKLLMKEFTHAVRSVAFSRDGKLLVSGSAVIDDNGDPVGDEVKVWNARTYALQRTISAGEKNGWANALAFAGDAPIFAAASRDSRIRVCNAKTGEVLQTLPGHLGEVLAVSFAPDGKLLASGGMDNTIRIWKVDGGRMLATLLPLQGDARDARPTDWLAITPEGYYDGSPGSERLIQWRVGPDLFPVEAFEAKFHHPEVVRKALHGEAIAGTPEAQQFASGQTIPPQVAFTTPRDGQEVSGDRLKVEVAVTDVHKVTRLEVLANGRPTGAKPLEVGAKPLEVGAKPLEIGAKPLEIGAKTIPAGHKFLQQFQVEIPLSAGESQLTLTGLAYDEDGLQARDEIQLHRPTAAGAAGNLYVLSVGVSKYQNPNYNLRFAGSDAEAFAGLWKQTPDGLYNQIDVTRLTDEQATTANVRAALFKLLEKATEKDSVALFLSGHGVQANETDYYFATHDIDASSQARVAETALPWTALQTALAGLRARRVFMFLDACHSGNALGGQDASNERMAELLVKRAGVMVFASSRGSEYSYELDDVKHGAFTEALIEGLGEGKADLEIGGKRTGVITAEELLAYLRARVPQLTNSRQTPSCPLLRDFGDAFVLMRVHR